MQILQQTVPSGVQTIQLVQSGSGTQAVMQQAPQIMTQHGGQTVLLGGAQFQQAQQQAQQQQQQQGLQIVQQVVGPDGQIQQIPIQLSANQLQMLRMQLQANQGQVQGQAPLIIQTAPVQQGNPTVMTTTSQNGTQIIQSS
jgi:nuclear transcription factor Y gamma